MRIAIVLPFITACVIEHGQTPPDQLSVAQQTWQTMALPALEAGNCITCHASQDTIGFLAGDDQEAIRQTLLASGRVDLAHPAESTLFTKGVHEGGSFTADQISAILTWLESE